MLRGLAELLSEVSEVESSDTPAVFSSAALLDVLRSSTQVFSNLSFPAGGAGATATGSNAGSKASHPNETHDAVQQRLIELSALITVLREPSRQLQFIPTYHSFIGFLKDHGVIEALVDGLEKAATESGDSHHQLLLLYSEALYYLWDHKTAVCMFNEDSPGNSFVMADPSRTIPRLYDVVCELSKGHESFQQRAAILLVCILCHIGEGGASAVMLSEYNALLSLADHKLVEHFMHTPNGLVSHFVVLAVLQRVDVEVPMNRDAALRIWQTLTPILSNGCMYDSDLSSIIEYDGSDSVLLSRVKQTLGITLGRVWDHVHDRSWWSHFTSNSLLSVCRSAYMFAYTWSGCSPVSSSLPCPPGMVHLREYVAGELVKLCEGSSGEISIRSAADRQTDMSVLLTLYAYLCVVHLDTSSCVEEVEQIMTLPVSNDLSASPFVFPIQRTSSGITLLPQYMLYLQTMVFSQNLSTSATRNSACNPLSVALFEGAGSLLCVLMTLIEEDNTELLKKVEAAAGVNMQALLFHMFVNYVHLEDVSVLLVSQLFSVMDYRYRSMWSHRGALVSSLLTSHSLGSVIKSKYSLARSIMEAHLAASFLRRSGESSGAVLAYWVNALSGLQPGTLVSHPPSVTLLLTILRYISECAWESEVVSHLSASVISSAIAVLVEGAVVLRRLKSTAGYAKWAEFDLSAALQAALRFTAFLSFTGESDGGLSLVRIVVPVIASSPSSGPLVLFSLALAEELCFSIRQLAAVLWCVTIQRHPHEVVHAIRSNATTTTRTDVYETVTKRLRSMTGRDGNVLCLQMLRCAQVSSPSLLALFIGPHGSHPVQDMNDLPIVKVLCELVSGKESKRQEKALALEILNGLGLTEVLQLSMVVSKLLVDGGEPCTAFLSGSLCAAAAGFVVTTLQRRVEDNVKSVPPLPQQTPSLSRAGPSTSRPRLPSISLPSSTQSTGAGSYGESLTSVIQCCTQQLLAVHTALAEVKDRFACCDAAHSSPLMRILGYPLLLGPHFYFSDIDGADDLNCIASLVFVAGKICTSLDKAVVLNFSEGGSSSAASLSKHRELLAAVLQIIRVVASSNVPLLGTLEVSCVTAALTLAKSLALVDERAGGLDKLSPSLILLLEQFGTVFLSANKSSLAFVADAIAVLRPYSIPTDGGLPRHVVERLCNVIAESVVVTAAVPHPELATYCQACDAVLLEAHLFFTQLGSHCPVPALRSVVKALAASLDDVSTHIFVNAPSDVWVERFETRVQLLQTLLSICPLAMTFLDKQSIVTLAVALGQLMSLAPARHTLGRRAAFEVSGSSSQSIPPPMIEKPCVIPPAAHRLWCSVLSLLVAVVSCAGRRSDILSLAASEWTTGICTLLLTPRFKGNLTCVSGSIPGYADGLYLSDVLECYWCTRLVALVSASGQLTVDVVPQVMTGAQLVLSSRFPFMWKFSAGGACDEAEEREQMKVMRCHIMRDQLSTLLLQSSLILKVDSFWCSAAAPSHQDQISFPFLYKFIARQLRTIEKYVGAGGAVGSTGGFGNSISAVERGTPASSRRSRSPSVSSTPTVTDSDDSVLRYSGANQDISFETLPLYVESVELSLALFISGACVITQLRSDDIAAPLTAELRSSSERLISVLDTVEKGLQSANDSVAIIPFVKLRRKQIQKIVTALQLR